MTKGDSASIGPISWRSGIVIDFARSELFERTFEEGMDLVEETACYLDGGGRQDAKILSRAAAMAYAAESMRLTTRLMQVASWLLVQRAVREGDMAASAACEDRYRLATPPQSDAPRQHEGLPAPLVELLDRSERLYERVSHLDRRMYIEAHDMAAPASVHGQLDRLRGVFGA